MGKELETGESVKVKGVSGTGTVKGVSANAVRVATGEGEGFTDTWYPRDDVSRSRAKADDANDA